MELRSTEPGIACRKTNKLPEYEFVSVVIPCYNEERFIAKALEQLAGQYEKSRF
jgi:cellulose synthase/poly-beta-1,6-N-acetylglucosamine synthase-like glycosyltransferase